MAVRQIGFYGTNGNAIPPAYGPTITWTGTTGTIDLQSNRLRLQTANIGSYGSVGQVATNITVQGNFDIRFRVTPGQAWSNEFYCALSVGDVFDPTDTIQPTNGVSMNNDGPSALNLGQLVGGVSNGSGDVAWAPSGSTVYLWRFKRDGQKLYGKVWADATIEPTDWTLTYTCTGVLAASPQRLMFSVQGGGAVAAARWDLDQLSIDDGISTLPLIFAAILDSPATPVSLTDTGAGTDVVTQIATALAGDTGAGTDLVTRIATALVGDTGAGADSLSAGALVVLTDTAAGADLITQIATSMAETGAGADLVTRIASTLAADVGAGTDTVTRIATTLAGDTGAGADLITQIRTTLPADSGAGTDTMTAGVHVVLTDTGGGVDSIVSLRVGLSDLAATLDALTQFHESFDSTVRVGLVVVSFDAGHVLLDTFDPGLARKG